MIGKCVCDICVCVWVSVCVCECVFVRGCFLNQYFRLDCHFLSVADTRPIRDWGGGGGR